MAQDVFGIVGSVIAGAYHVETVVAEGGFAVVYRAFHAGFQAPVALKCLKVPAQFSQRQKDDFLEQFRAEAVLLFRLSSGIPTVVRPLHVDALTTADGRFVPFMALEWLEGETLDAIVASRKKEGRAPFAMKKLVRLLTPVARALERAHSFAGPDGPISIVHRDLKPENIFVANVAGEQVVKVLDFGIGKAKSVASQVVGRASQSSAGVSSFTPAYAAPEQWLPKRYGQTGPWTDVWGLALTMVEVLAARPIIDGDQAAMMGTTLDEQRRPTPRNEAIAVSDAVEAVFQRALAVDPRDRYADAGAFWNDLLMAVGVDADAGPAQPPRDRRSEGGVIPRVEQIEAAMLRSSAPPQERPSRPVRSSEPPVPERPAPRSASPYPAFDGAAIPQIPDLNVSVSPARSERPSVPSMHGELEFDDSVTPVEMALDLPPNERALARPVGSSSPPAPSGAPAVALRTPSPFPAARPGSGAFARYSSGSHPVLTEPSPSDPATRPSRPPATPTPVPGPGDRSSVRPDGPPERGSMASSLTPLPAHRPSLSVRPPLTSFRPEPAPETDVSLVRRLTPGVALVFASIVVTLLDTLYAARAGEVFTLGSLRVVWIAGALMLTGVALVVYRLMPRDH